MTILNNARANAARHSAPKRPANQLPPGPPTPVRSQLELELSEPVRVLSARLWVAALAVALAVAVGASWIWTGTWPRHLSAPAIVAHGSGPVTARSPSAGSVAELAVTVGEPVRAGQTVAVIAGTAGRASVHAPTSGLVTALPLGIGDEARVGTALVLIDPVAQPATVTLVLQKYDDVAGLLAGQQVSVSAAGQQLTGRIADGPALPTTGAELERRYGRPTAGVPSDGTPLWLVGVTLDSPGRGSTAAEGSGTVALPSVRIYRLAFGGDS